MTSTAWHARLLGAAQLTAAELALPLERKAAALFTHLALEGATRRSQLTQLLWPDTREAAARNNLVHLLRKLRSATGTDLVQGAEVLSVAEGLEVDALTVRDAFVRGEYGEVLQFRGQLLQGLEYDDCPDLEEWVEAQRERLREWRLAALRAEAQRLEADGLPAEALPLAHALLELDPVSEDGWRRVMRLHYLRGDRPAALRAYHACGAALRRELGVGPMPETTALAREIERGSVPTVVRPAKAALPLAVLRPPNLVGREREWAQLEEAWARGQMIWITGAPGVGKTRLALDFAASKGAFLEFKGRPGDVHQPFTTSARNYRASLARAPGTTLEPWVQRELGRVLPEYAPPGEVVEPLGSSADLLRYRQAMLEVCRATWQGLSVIVADDLQFFDHPSTRDGMYFFALPHEHPGPFPRVIGTFRRGELVPEMQSDLDQVVRLGGGVLIDLPNLEQEATETLLNDLGVASDTALRDRLIRYSGGSPLFLLEIVRHLVEGGAIGPRGARGDLSNVRLPLTPKVGEVIARRLERLSAPALATARAAAVLQSDFDLEQVAEMLGAPLLDVAQAWEELEESQIVSAGRFSHDLVHEAIVAGLPVTVHSLLHRSAARMLERTHAPAARIAHHWRSGEKPHLLAPWLLRAADAAFDSYQVEEAAHLYEEAADTFDLIGEHAQAHTARARRDQVRQVQQADRDVRRDAP